MKLRNVFLSLITLLTIAGNCAADGMPSVDVKQAAAMQAQGVLLLDVREENEYREVRAPNTLLIPLSRIGERVDEIAMYKDKPIAIICRSGRRSARAWQFLHEEGYTKAVNVEGGMIAWEAAGLPVERGDPPAY